MESINLQLENNSVNKNVAPDILMDYVNFMTEKGFTMEFYVQVKGSAEKKSMTSDEVFALIKNSIENGEDYLCIFNLNLNDEVTDEFVDDITDYFVKRNLTCQKINLEKCLVSKAGLEKLQSFMSDCGKVHNGDFSFRIGLDCASSSSTQIA